MWFRHAVLVRLRKPPYNHLSGQNRAGFRHTDAHPTGRQNPIVPTMMQLARSQIVAVGSPHRSPKVAHSEVTLRAASDNCHLHGPEKCATKLMAVELTDEAPPPKLLPAKRKRASTRLSPVTILASGK